MLVCDSFEIQFESNSFLFFKNIGCVARHVKKCFISKKNFKMLTLAKKYIVLDISATAVDFFSKRFLKKYINNKTTFKTIK